MDLNNFFVFRSNLCINYNIISALRPGLKTGMENYIIWSEIGSGFGEPGGIPPPRIPRSTQTPPPPLRGDSYRICQEPKARAMQENPNPESLKYLC